MSATEPTLVIYGSLKPPPYRAEMGPGVAVYRLFSADGGLLYIGVAGNPLQRWSQHSAKMKWWPLVRRCELAWLPTRRDALEEEQRAIRSEFPAHNDVYNDAVRAYSGPEPTEAKIHGQKIRYADSEGEA